MPLTPEDKKVKQNFTRRYGAKAGERAFYASINSGKVKNIPEARKMARKQKRRSRR